MNVVLIFVTCLLNPVFGRAITSKRTIAREIHANKTFKACGPKINDLYRIVCQLSNDSTVNFLGTNHRSKRGVVDECCNRGCTYEAFAEYCPGNSSIFDLLVQNELRGTTQTTKLPTTTTLTPTTEPSNEIVKKNRTIAASQHGSTGERVCLTCKVPQYKT